MPSRQRKRDGLDGSALTVERWEPTVTLRPGLASHAVRDHREECFRRGLTNRMIQDEQRERFGECNTLVFIRHAREKFNASTHNE